MMSKLDHAPLFRLLFQGPIHICQGFEGKLKGRVWQYLKRKRKREEHLSNCRGVGISKRFHILPSCLFSFP